MKNTLKIICVLVLLLSLQCSKIRVNPFEAFQHPEYASWRKITSDTGWKDLYYYLIDEYDSMSFRSINIFYSSDFWEES
jgi:hypothetical protein